MKIPATPTRRIRRISLLFIILAAAAGLAIDARAQTCIGPEIVTVNAVAANDIVSGSWLDLIGFGVTADGTVQLTYSYSKLPENAVPGPFVLKSFDANGTLLDTVDLSDVNVPVSLRDDLSFEGRTWDQYAAGSVFGQANGCSFSIGMVLEDDVLHNALTDDPFVYLNDLDRWPYRVISIGIDVDGVGQYYTSLYATITSLSAVITPTGCPSTSEIKTLVDELQNNAFRSPGQRSALLSRLTDIQEDIDSGNKADALSKLRNLRRRVDGCGASPGHDDWIVDCADQIDLRTLIDQLINTLES